MNSHCWSLTVFLCLLFAANAAVGQQDLPLFPKYQVLGVIYAPPGSSSSVSYTNSTQVGSSHSMVSDSSTTTTQTQTNTSGFSLFGLGYSQTNTTSDSWVSDYQNSSSESLQTTTGNGISTPGPISSALGVDHDNDLIVLWLNPILKTTLMPPITSGGTTTYPIQWSGFMFNSCDLNATQYPVNFVQLMNGCDPYSFPGPDIVYVPVYCLKNPYWPPNNCSQYLSHTSRFWDLDPWAVDSVTKVPLGPGLDIQDYADILQADPLVTQTLVANNTQPGENVYTNPCHPTYGINFDPNEQEITPQLAQPPFMGTWPADYCGTPGTAMERFNFFSGSIPYPAPQPNGQPNTSTGNLSNNVVNSEGSQATDTHTHSFNESTSLTFSATVSYGPLGGGWNVSNLSAGFNFGTTSGSGSSWTDTQTIGHTATQSETDSAQYSVTGPKGSDNWNGPITYNVYQDTVYGTFAFRDPNRSTSTQLITAGKTSPIGVAFSGSTNFGSQQVGKHSAAITVTLTNNSPNLMTMQSPALSFSDLALDPADNTKLVSSFVIVSGSDGCSNKVLKANTKCTLKIEFAPTLNAAPNAMQASYPVAAYVIAGGNETVPVADSGEITYDEQVLVTNTVITISGGKETAVTVSGTALPAPVTCPTSSIAYPECNEGATLDAANPASGQPNGYQFPPFTGTPEVEEFIFTNFNSSTVTFPSYPGDVALTDTTNFSIASNSQNTDTCAGKTIGAIGSSANSCKVWVQFAPGAQAAIGTRVTAMGAVNWPSGTTGTIPLAFGAAAAGPTPVVTVQPLSETLGCAAGPNGGHPFNTCPGSGGVEVTNSGNITFTPSVSTSSPFSATPSAACTALAPNTSCTVMVSFAGGGTSSYTTTGTLNIQNASVALSGQFDYVP